MVVRSSHPLRRCSVAGSRRPTAPESARHLRDWQRSRKRDVNFTPEAASWDVSRGVLSVYAIRSMADGDFAAVDHRISGPSSRFELFGAGRSWLGPPWTIVAEPGGRTRPSRARGSRSRAPDGGVAYRVGHAGHSIDSLAGRPASGALVGSFDRRCRQTSQLGVRLACPPLIKPEALEGCRGFRLKGPGARESAVVLPIGLPSLPYETDRGAFLIQDNGLLLDQEPSGRRTWLPLLVSWDAAADSRGERPGAS